MKDTLADLNDHLFEEMERLNDDDLKGDKLLEEINRSKAMGNIGDKIIQNADVILKAKIAYGDTNSANPEDRPTILLGKDRYEIHGRTKRLD